MTLRLLGLASAAVLFWLGPSAPRTDGQRPDATLSGIVRDEGTGKPIAGVRVYVAGMGTSMQVTTATGEYHLPHVPSWPALPQPTSDDSTVTVVAQRVGYYRERRDVILIEGEPAVLNITMRRDPRLVQ